MPISNVQPLCAAQVADHFLRKIDYSAGDSITNLKIQKLCYFAQAHSLVKFGYVLFSDRIEAWAHGPVIPDLYHRFKAYKWMSINTVVELKNKNKIPSKKEHTIPLLDAVWDRYGNQSARALERMTHGDDPWRNAYGDRPLGAICNVIITPEAIKSFYDEQSSGRTSWSEPAYVQNNKF